ncbi:hypothetical protein [Vibrio phage phiKT1028]|nr:hypothetical protein [Vibrio phage phiKT1028]
MSRKPKGRRNVQVDLRRRQSQKRNQRTIALVVAKINDMLYFSGSHVHKMDGKHWFPSLKHLARHDDRKTAIKVAIQTLCQETEWQLLHFIAVDVGDSVELFSFTNVLHKATYLTAPEKVMELIDGTLKMTQKNIDDEVEVEGTQLTKYAKITGFAYYLFNSTGYDIKGSEDDIADSLFETGTFDYPFDPNEYERLTPTDFSEFFTRQEQACIKLS